MRDIHELSTHRAPSVPRRGLRSTREVNRVHPISPHLVDQLQKLW